MVKSLPSLVLASFLALALPRKLFAYDCDYSIDCTVGSFAGDVKAAGDKGKGRKLRDAHGPGSNTTSYHLDGSEALKLGDRFYDVSYTDVGNDGPDSRDDLSIVEKTKQGQEWGYGRTWLDHALNGFYNLVRRYGRSTEFDTLSPQPSTPEDWERADNAYKTVLIHLGRELLRN